MLGQPFFVGDGLVDVKTGHATGYITVLMASTNGLLLRLLTEQDAELNYLVKTFEEAVRILENVDKPHAHKTRNTNIHVSRTAFREVEP